MFSLDILVMIPNNQRTSWQHFKALSFLSGKNTNCLMFTLPCSSRHAGNIQVFAFACYPPHQLFPSQTALSSNWGYVWIQVGWGVVRRAREQLKQLPWMRVKQRCPFHKLFRVLLQKFWPMRAQQALKWSNQWLKVCPVYKPGEETFWVGWPLFWPWWTGSDPKDCYLCTCLVFR